MGGTVGEVGLAVGVEAHVLRVDQTPAGRNHHARKFGTCRWLGLEPFDLYEIVEFLLAHRRKFSIPPKTKTFGWVFILLTNEPFSAALRFQSAGERNVGLTF